jgi:hypothetical protein
MITEQRGVLAVLPLGLEGPADNALNDQRLTNLLAGKRLAKERDALNNEFSVIKTVIFHI